MGKALAGLELLRVAEFPRGCTIEEIFTAVRRLADETGRAPFVVLDYLQRILSRMERPGEDRRALCGRLSDELAEATRSLGATFLVLSSIGRHLYGERAESMADDELNAAAKESGEIEYDAGAVMFIRRCDRLPDGRYSAILRLTATRYSGGSDGKAIDLVFDGARNVFEAGTVDNLQPIDEEVIGALADCPKGLAVADLAKNIATARQTVDKAIARLRRMGLVTKRPPPPYPARGSKSRIPQHPCKLIGPVACLTARPSVP